MDFFIPRDCAIDPFTPYWLLATTAALALAAIVLLALVGTLWRRGSYAGLAWRLRLPLALPVLWAIVCGLLAAQAWVYYGDVTTPLLCAPLTPCSYKGICMPVAQLVGEARFALLVTVVMLIAGWLAFSRIARRARSS